MGGSQCPECGDTLLLIVEPGILEFYCAKDHSFAIDELISREAEGIRAVLREALAFWVAYHAGLVKEAEAARTAHHAAILVSYERRLQVAAERLNTLRTALAKVK